MNKLTHLIMLLTLAFSLTGCGEASDPGLSNLQLNPGSGTNDIAAAENAKPASYDLIINNGRGTYNNQDTERYSAY